MKVVTTFHSPSSVVGSVKCRLGSRDLEHLVVAKLNRVDVYSLQPHGLQHECGADVWGKVFCVRAIPLAGTARSKLVLMIGHPDPEVIFFSYEEFADGRKELAVNHSLSLHEQGSRPAEFFNDLLIHPSGKLGLAHCYAGRIKLIQLKGGDYESDFDSLLEHSVLSMAFVSAEDKGEYSVAILHLDPFQRIQLLVRDVAPSGGSGWDLSPLPSTILQPTAISSKTITDPTEIVPFLIPVPPATNNDDDDDDGEGEEDEGSKFLGGVLVVGGRKLLLYELSSDQARAKQQGKVTRLEKMKADLDPIKVKTAKVKQNERDAKKRKPTASVDWPCSIVTAWCGVEGAPFRFFLGDGFGALSLLSLDNVKTIGLLLLPLGIASPPTSLTYLTDQVLYLGSHLGDSQLITTSSIPSPATDQLILKIPIGIKTVSRTSSIPFSNNKRKQKAEDDMEVDDSEEQAFSGGRIIHPDGSYIKVAQSFKNIGPIIDAVLVDTEGSGQQQLVTCSGGQNTGSLNIMRNGSEIQELAFIPGVVNLTGIWAVKSHFEAINHTHIVASTSSRTLLYQFKDAGAETSFVQIAETAARDFIIQEPTLAVSNVARRTLENGRSRYTDSRMVVQVVPSGVYLLEYDGQIAGYTERARFVPDDVPIDRKPTEVAAANANSSQVAVAFNGGLVVILNINDAMNAFNCAVFRLDIHSHEISAISCMPVNRDKPFSSLMAVSYWTTNEVEIFSISYSSMKPIAKSEPLPALVRSLQLFNFGSDPTAKSSNYHPILICGLSDGSFAYFSWNATSKQLLEKKVVSLGHAPVQLTVCEVEGKKAIFAAGNRATVISLDKKKLVHSPVMLKDLTAACQFNTETFSKCLIFAGPNGLQIGVVKDLNKLNIRAIPLGYANPQRIDYIPLLKKFAVACAVREPNRVGDYEPVNSVLRLYDDAAFNVYSEFKCQANEQITSLANFTRKINDEDIPYICVGSILYPDEGHKPVQGRVRLFTTLRSDAKDAGTELVLVTSADVIGCVYVVKIVDNKLVVAAEAVVQLYKIVQDTTHSLTLELVTSWCNSYIVSSLGSFGDRIVIGDQISTVSLIKVSEKKFEPEARDYGPLCPVAVEALDEKHLVAANSTMNLHTFALGRSGQSNVLEQSGGYHVADFVTKFIRGGISADSPGGTFFTSEAIFCTSSGRVGVIINVDDQDLALGLSSLQRNLGQCTLGVGGESHARFRAPRKSRGRNDGEGAAFGFLDGDFLETFLGILENDKQVDKVYSGSSEPELLTLPLEDYKRALETLQSLH